MSSSFRPERDVGQVVDGKYRIMRLLGAGTSGAVFEARHVENRQRVALKMLHPQLLDSEEHVRRFLREARSAAKIDHPGVVAFLDVGQAEDGRPYLTQEFLHGENMDAALEAGTLTIPQVFEIAIQLLDALSAVHDVGLVHRDVKPENVLLMHDEFGDLRSKLVDFGVVKPKVDVGDTQGDALTDVGMVVGTPHYMSPEQAQGHEVDGRSDVWSVGVVLYEAFTGKPPFDAPTPTQILMAILIHDPAPLSEKRPDLPQWLDDVVHRALARKLDERWPSAEDMADALRSGIRA